MAHARHDTLIDSLEHWARARPDHQALAFLKGGSILESLTYAALKQRALVTAAALSNQLCPGDRVLLAFEPGLSFVVAILACQYLRAIPVPCRLPRIGSRTRSLTAIVGACRPRVVLTTIKSRSLIESQLDACRHVRPTVVAADALRAPVATFSCELPGADDIALLQFTSGSTSRPKGVSLRHRHLIANHEMIKESFDHDEGLTVVGWLPTHHDMGLVGNVLHPLWLGGTAILMSPSEFFFHPERWLQAISKFKASTAGAPPWGYDWCSEKVADAVIRDLDLNDWRVAFVGAEPIHANTLETFARRFAPAGFNSRSFLPCYGLAEATLFVAGAQAQSPLVQGQIQNRLRVSVGRPRSGTQIKIVDPSTRTELEDGDVGEVVVKGPSVGEYWNADAPGNSIQPAGSGTLGQTEFVSTGDLGCLRDDQLFITGRLKDVLIKGGNKFHAEDIEVTVRECCGLRPAEMVAAFSVDEHEREQAVVVYETRLGRSGDRDGLSKAVKNRVRIEHGLELSSVIQVARGAIPRTSSGKVRRAHCRDLFLSGELHET